MVISFDLLSVLRRCYLSCYVYVCSVVSGQVFFNLLASCMWRCVSPLFVCFCHWYSLHGSKHWGMMSIHVSGGIVSLICVWAGQFCCCQCWAAFLLVLSRHGFCAMFCVAIVFEPVLSCHCLGASVVAPLSWSQCLFCALALACICLWTVCHHFSQWTLGVDGVSPVSFCSGSFDVC